MKLVRTYVLTGKNPTKVIDYSEEEPKDLSDDYSNLARDSSDQWITASLTVYREHNGNLTSVTYSDSTSMGLKDLSVLLNLYAEDVSRAEDDPLRLK